MKWAHATKGDTRAFLDLGLEPRDALILDSVFETSVLAIRAIAVVSLGGENGLANGVDLIRRDEAHDIG